MNKENLLKEYGVELDTAIEFWGDISSYEESLKEFYDTLNEKVKNLEYYKNNNDSENYGILAHSIKSECKYLGFMKDSETFLQHEMAGKNNDLLYIQQHFEDIQNVSASIARSLASYFNLEADNEKKILIADDSSIIINFINNNIKETYTTLRASNGKEAIDMIEKENIYAIILDLNMPIMNGFEVLEYMKNHELLEKIPVIIITGDDTKETIQKAFLYPILDVLNKPFNDENINRILISIESFHNRKNQ